MRNLGALNAPLNRLAIVPVQAVVGAKVSGWDVNSRKRVEFTL